MEMGGEASFYFVVSFWISEFLYIKHVFINVVIILFDPLNCPMFDQWESFSDSRNYFFYISL